MNNKTFSRRSLLTTGVKTAATLGLSNLFAPLSNASGSGDRICICIYLIGGNDSNNMIVPLDAAEYDAYSRARGQLALAQDTLLPVTGTLGAKYGLHPSLKGVQQLYNQGSLAVVANVGNIDRPVSKASLDPKSLSPSLFQHSAAMAVRFLPQGHLSIDWVDKDSVDTPPSTSSPRAGGDLAAVGKRDAVSTTSAVPRGSLGDRLVAVSKSLNQRGTVQRTYFFALSGFDTHCDQLTRQDALLAELDEALLAFYNSLYQFGIADRVTVFTDTEFNRALVSNARGGTDHGWGGHQLVLGGNVRGGEIYGHFPSMKLGGNDDLGTTGIWIPSTSYQQYAATLASWYGRTSLTSLPQFRSLANFGEQNLGFVAQ